MKLSEIMSHMGLSGYAQVALCLFLAAFFAQVVWIFLPRNSESLARTSVQPLDDGTPTDSKSSSTEQP